MVMHCVAYNCNNLHDKRFNIQFHGFPFKRPDVLKQWVNAIRRVDWEPTKYSKLCSAHFLESDYLQRPGQNVRWLKLDAVPSVFNFSPHLMKEKVCRKPLKRILENSMIKSEEPPLKLFKSEDFFGEPTTVAHVVDEPTTSKYVDAQTQTFFPLETDIKLER